VKAIDADAHSAHWVRDQLVAKSLASAQVASCAASTLAHTLATSAMQQETSACAANTWG